MSYLTDQQLFEMGFLSVGTNVRLSSKASIYGADRISISDDVRIDDFCILSAGVGGIAIGHHVHVAAYTSLIGAGRISLGDYCNLSSRVSVYSSSDDYSGATMTNPMVSDDFKAVDSRPVCVGRHAIVGCGSVILPGVTIGEGAAIGSLSLVRGDCAPFATYAGSPARQIGRRKRDFLELEAQFESSQT